MDLVTIHRGTFSVGVEKFRDIMNVQFPLIDGTIGTNNKGKYIQVDGVPVRGFPKRVFKIFINSANDFTTSTGELQTLTKISKHVVRAPTIVDVPKTPNAADFIKALHGPDDEKVKSRIAERFDTMNYLVQSAAEGHINGVIISGPPGVGKSWGVENSLMNVLYEPDVMKRLNFVPSYPGETLPPVDNEKFQEQFDLRYKFISGKVSPTGLYDMLWKASDERSVLVFDDCDGILQEEVTLGLLKKAMDISGKDRVLTWSSPYANRMEAPSRFVFKGTIIIITNINFDKLANKRENALTEHLEALMSRTYYLDLTMHSLRDKYLWIEHQCRDKDVLEKLGLATPQVKEVMDYFTQNILNLREVSIRSVEKIGKLCLLHGNWARVCDLTLLSSKALMHEMTTSKPKIIERTPGDDSDSPVTDTFEPKIVDLSEVIAAQEAQRAAEEAVGTVEIQAVG
jgi:hypothetical protein